MVFLVKRGTKKVEKIQNTNEKNFLFKSFHKTAIVYSLLFICDVFLVIYCAKRNKVHYVEILNKSVFIGKTRDMIFGRNYINLIITFFFFGYFLIMNRFFLHRKNTKIFVISSFFLFVVVNFLLFYLFTEKIY